MLMQGTFLAPPPGLSCGPLLWADLGNARIVPGLDRHSAAAKNEALRAALLLRAPPAPAAADCNLTSHEQSIEALLPAYATEDVCLGEAVGEYYWGKVVRGTVRGRSAIIKVADLISSPVAEEVVTNEVCHSSLGSRLHVLPFSAR